jgi:hypothetical protein
MTRSPSTEDRSEPQAERRAGQRAERSALATKRIEQRDQLVVLIDKGRRWAVNL